MPDYEIAAQGLDEAAACIKEFHDKMLFETYSLYDEEANDEVKSNVNHDLTKAGHALSFHSNKLQSLVQFSVRATRAHLIAEEAAETIRALAAQDRERLLDGLIDLLYVTVGTCVVLDLPVGDAFVEVHKSNMSKEKQASDPYANRVRDKGPNYSPPDLKRILELWDRDRNLESAEEAKPTVDDVG